MKVRAAVMRQTINRTRVIDLVIHQRASVGDGDEACNTRGG